MIQKIRNIVETTDSRAGVVFDLLVQFFIVISIIVFSLETIPTLSTESIEVLSKLEVFIIALFCCEYILRFIVAKQKTKFVFSFWGMVDLLAILPFFLLSFDLIMIRALRLLRLFRILKLGRYSSSMSRIMSALKIAKEFSGYWKLLQICTLLPDFFNDFFYDYIALNRYKWFGKQENCMIPTPSLKAKFLE